MYGGYCELFYCECPNAFTISYFLPVVEIITQKNLCRVIIYPSQVICPLTFAYDIFFFSAKIQKYLIRCIWKLITISKIFTFCFSDYTNL